MSKPPITPKKPASKPGPKRDESWKDPEPDNKERFERLLDDAIGVKKKDG
jgi:hypothetical protein